MVPEFLVLWWSILHKQYSVILNRNYSRLYHKTRNFDVFGDNVRQLSLLYYTFLCVLIVWPAKLYAYAFDTLNVKILTDLTWSYTFSCFLQPGFDSCVSYTSTTLLWCRLVSIMLLKLPNMLWSNMLWILSYYAQIIFYISTNIRHFHSLILLNLRHLLYIIYHHHF